MYKDKIVDWLISFGLENAEFASHTITFEQLAAEFNLCEDVIQDMSDEIREEAESRDEVWKLAMYANKEFIIYFHTKYCKNIVKK